ncbi:MAG: serine hydrolase, partial [Vulcanimicrobiaceae bacterium]
MLLHAPLRFAGHQRIEISSTLAAESLASYSLPWSIHSDGKPIYVHQLLSHTAGIPDDYTLVGSYGFAVAALRNAHTLFAPGTSWSYSNDGLATAGAVLVAIGKRPWQDQIQSTVFNPIGMRHSSAFFTPADMDNVALGYEFRDA